ncbi:MAG: sigma-70 family RNA polymerase sigma factor [bacterium]|nr:sigma-70 family RNA polymerase sigma factor [bacterium]
MTSDLAGSQNASISEAERRRLFTKFYEEHYDISFRYLRARRFPVNHTRDVLQHCFEIAWNRFDEYLATGRPKYWFFGILKNRERYVASRLAVSPLIDPNDTHRSQDERISPESYLIESEERSYFYEIICALPPQYADVVKLRLEGFDYKTIAELLETSVKSVEHRMRRALVKLEGPIREFVSDYLGGL